MAKTIPQLTDATNVNAADELIIQQGGITKRATGAELAKGLNTINGTVNVKDFGAVGDGVADDTAAIQAAIGSGKVAFFPKGTYLVSASISLTGATNFALLGESENASIIKLSPSASFATDIFSFFSCSSFSISHLSFQWNNNASSQSRALLRVQSSNTFYIENNNVVHNSAPTGVYVESCNNFYINSNRISRATQSSATNYNINVSSNVSTSSTGFITSNYIYNSGVGVVGERISICDNYCLNNKYGANIATFAQGATGFFGQYVVSGNYCAFSTGTDADGFLCSGMEIAGAYSTVTNNVIHDNDGAGLRLFAYQSTCSNNIIFDNGRGGGSVDNRVGILSCYADPSIVGGNATYSANYSIIAGNLCFDRGAGHQLYGYTENSTSITGITLTGNHFDGNATAPASLKATTGNFYDFDWWVSYTPVITASSGTLTSGACAGRYMMKGKSVFFQAFCTITSNGTGSGSILVTLPKPVSAAAINSPINSVGLVSKKTFTATIGPTGTTATVTNYDGTYAGATGEQVLVSGWYQI